MNIDAIAEDLIAVKTRLDLADSEYIAKRDLMFNALNAQPSGSYTWSGYTFSKLSPTNVISVNKESIVTALHSAGLEQDQIHKILGDALIERERSPGIRITGPQA